MANFTTIKLRPRRKPRIPDRQKLLAFLASAGFGWEHTAHLAPKRLLQMATRFGFFHRQAIPNGRSFSKAQATQRLS